MKNKILMMLTLFTGMTLGSCAQHNPQEQHVAVQPTNTKMVEKIIKSNEEWKEILTPEQYHILREQGTEFAFTGKYWSHKEKGIYVCAACDLELFSSQSKFKSGSGWPSFYEPVAAEHVGVETDGSYGMVRTEVHCARCGGHLGHIFEDGPKPTGLRYCINSASLNFRPE